MAKKKKQRKNKEPSKLWEHYKMVDGKLVRDPMCPKCSVFLAQHKDRLTCGKCGYTEFKKPTK